jgi:hypothetical protein
MDFLDIVVIVFIILPLEICERVYDCIAGIFKSKRPGPVIYVADMEDVLPHNVAAPKTKVDWRQEGF